MVEPLEPVSAVREGAVPAEHEPAALDRSQEREPRQGAVRGNQHGGGILEVRLQWRPNQLPQARFRRAHLVGCPVTEVIPPGIDGFGDGFNGT